jgi:hypothetical protein
MPDRYPIFNDKETFRFFYFTWDIGKAWALVNARPDPSPNGVTDVKKAAEVLGDPPGTRREDRSIRLGSLGVSWKAVQADLGGNLYNTDVPLLYVNLPEMPDGTDLGGTIVDGCHRLAKALLTGREQMDVIVLTKEEEEACRVSPGLREWYEMFAKKRCQMCGEERSVRDFKREGIEVCDECELWAEEHRLDRQGDLRKLGLDVLVLREQIAAGKDRDKLLRETIGHIVDRDSRWTRDRLCITLAAHHFLEERDGLPTPEEREAEEERREASNALTGLRPEETGGRRDDDDE